MIFSQYCGVMWYSQALLLFLLLIPLLRKVMNWWGIGESIIVGSFIGGYLQWNFLDEIIGQIVHFFGGGYGEIYRILAYVPSYLIGVYLGVRMPKEIINEKYNTASAKALAIFFLLLSYTLPYGFFSYILIMLRAVFVWIILDKRIFKFELRWWMQVHFWIYAIHFFFITPIVPKLCNVYFYVQMSSVFVTFWGIVNFAVVVFLSEVSAFGVSKFLPNMYSLLTGGRGIQTNRKDGSI